MADRPTSLGRHVVRAVARAPMGLREKAYLFEVGRGLLVTWRHFFVNLARHTRALLGIPTAPGAVTVQYPDDPAVLAARARTRHRLLKRPDGTPRCVACMLCETICPAKCIRITAEESPDPGIEKRAKTFDIDLGLCVFCGYCVEACPVDAIHMDSNDEAVSAYSREQMIWRIDELLGDKKKTLDLSPLPTGEGARRAGEGYSSLEEIQCTNTTNSSAAAGRTTAASASTSARCCWARRPATPRTAPSTRCTSRSS